VTDDQTISRLEQYKSLLTAYRRRDGDRDELRSQLNQEKAWVRRQVIEAGCFVTVTVGPPPAIGGLVAQNIDPFTMLFEPPWGVDLGKVVLDMIDHTIGALRSGIIREKRRKDPSTIQAEITKGYAFVAMPIDPADPTLDDVLDAIKEAAKRCGITAERVDEPTSNERITDRILQSIKRAEFVIVDLTHSRPNVYYEAGFAHGFGKIPVYIARHDTPLGFDLKDYPVIFFKSLKQLKDDLEKRLRGIAAGDAN
jgi:hypothetical protein